MLRPGPSTEFLRGTVTVGCRIDVTLGKRTIGADLPVTDVEIAYNADRTVPAQLTYVLPSQYVPVEGDQNAVAAGYGQRAHVTAILEGDGQRETVDLGWYQHNNLWQETDSGVKIVADDLMVALEEDEFLWPSSPKKGVRLSQEMQRLAGGVPVVFEEGMSDPVVDSSIQWTRSRTQSIHDLSVTYGFTYEIGADQCLHVIPMLGARKAEATYTGTDLLLGALREGEGRKPNILSAVGSQEVTNEHPAQTQARDAWEAAKKAATAAGIPKPSGVLVMSTTPPEKDRTSTTLWINAGKPYRWDSKTKVWAEAVGVSQAVVAETKAYALALIFNTTRIVFRSGAPDSAYQAGDVLLVDTSKCVPKKWDSGKNAWVAQVSDVKTTRRYVATETLNLPPFGPDYGRVHQIIEVDSATGPAMVKHALLREQANLSMLGQVRSFEIAFDPRIRGGAIIGVISKRLDGTSEYAVGRVVAYVMSPAFDKTMRVDVEVLKW